MGDFNHDLFQENLKITWLEFMESFCFKHIIEPTTRVTDNARTLIDLIYCNTPNNIISVDVPTLVISDHFPIFATRKINSLAAVENLISPSHIGLFKNFNEQQFSNIVKQIPWDNIKVFDDTNDVVETWSSLYLEIADKHLPLKQHRVKRQQQPKWLTGEIIDAIRTRER